MKLIAIETSGEVVKFAKKLKVSISVGMSESNAPKATVLNKIVAKAGLNAKFHENKDPEIFSPNDDGFFYETGIVVTDQNTLISVHAALKEGLKQYKIHDSDIMIFNDKETRQMLPNGTWEVASATSVETAAVPKGFTGKIGDVIETKRGKARVIGSTNDGKVKAILKADGGDSVAIGVDVDTANKSIVGKKPKELAATETSGKIRDFVGKVKDKLVGKKKKARTGDNKFADMQKNVANGNKKTKAALMDLMEQYAALKKAGKGDTKEAKQIGAQIGKIKHARRKKNKD